MSGGLVGRVEQLLEQARGMQLPWMHASDGSKSEVWGSPKPGELRPTMARTNKGNAAFIVAAVNLVEPLARVALAAHVVAELEDMNQPNTRALFAAWTELRAALAAVSGEPDE